MYLTVKVRIVPMSDEDHVIVLTQRLNPPGNPPVLMLFLHSNIIFSWVRKKHPMTGDCVVMPPLQDGDPFRSMSVVPYLEDLHSPMSKSTSVNDEETFTDTPCVPGKPEVCFRVNYLF